MSWNFRVLLSKDQREYFVAEVYYNGDGKADGWAAPNLLRWDHYDDLQGTVEKIREAFNKPILAVLDDDSLEEVVPVYAGPPYDARSQS